MEPQNPVPASPVAVLEGPSALFSSAWKAYKTNWKLLSGLFLLPVVLNFIGLLLNLARNPVLSVLSFLFSLGFMVFLIAAEAGAINALSRIETEPGAVLSWGGQFRTGFHYFWSVVLISIISGLVLFGSTALFVIPGFILMVYVGLAVFARVIDDKKAITAFTECYSLVKGRWWKVLGRILYLILAFIGVAIVVAIITYLIALVFRTGPQSPIASALFTIVYDVIYLVLIPLAFAYHFKLYQSLKATRLPAVAVGAFRKWVIAFIVIGAVAVVLIPVFGSIAFVSLMSARSNAYMNLQQQAYVQQQMNLQQQTNAQQQQDSQQQPVNVQPQ